MKPDYEKTFTAVWYNFMTQELPGDWETTMNDEKLEEFFAEHSTVRLVNNKTWKLLDWEDVYEKIEAITATVVELHK